MEKNDFLLYNEIIYHIHTCKDMDDLKRSILAQVKFIVPYTYASLMRVDIDPDTRAIRHRDPFCLPDSFTPLEEAWIDRDYQDESLWVRSQPTVRGGSVPALWRQQRDPSANPQRPGRAAPGCGDGPAEEQIRCGGDIGAASCGVPGDHYYEGLCPRAAQEAVRRPRPIW